MIFIILFLLLIIFGALLVIIDNYFNIKRLKGDIIAVQKRYETKETKDLIYAENEKLGNYIVCPNCNCCFDIYLPYKHFCPNCGIRWNDNTHDNDIEEY